MLELRDRAILAIAAIACEGSQATTSSNCFVTRSRSTAVAPGAVHALAIVAMIGSDARLPVAFGKDGILKIVVVHHHAVSLA